MIAFLTGCGGSTYNVQNPQPPPPTPMTVTVQTSGLTAGSVPVSGSVSLTATLTGTSTQVAEGVAWNLTCQGPSGTDCGTISSPSGTTITYTAPATISGNSLEAEIVAYAVAQETANNVSPITITTYNSSLPAGNYVLQAQGVDSSLNPYQFAGVITVDGQGGIRGGEQTVNSGGVSVTDPILSTGSSYFLGNDGRGTITLTTADNNVGVSGVETFAFVFLTNSQNPEALISEVDGFASATGTLNLQTSTAAPTGGYAFVVSGTDVVKTLPVAFGGVFNIDSANTISGNGSVVDELLGKKVNATALGLSGTLTAPDPFGVVTLDLTAPFGTANKPTPLQFVGYIVDASHIELIETDTAAGSSVAPFGLTGGLAIGQGAATGTFTSDASFSGTYVFGVTGVDLSNSNVAPNTLTTAGLFTTDSAGNLTKGFTDTFLDLNSVQGTTSSPQTGAQISTPFTGTYSVDSTGTGRASSTSITFNPEPKDNYDPTFYFYLTGLTGVGEPAALVLAAGDTVAPVHYESIGTGIAYLQSGTAAFSGDYGFSFTQELSGGSETDGTAQLNANAANTPPVSGVADASNGLGEDNGFLGTFNTPTSNPPFAGTLYANANAQNFNVFPLPSSPPMTVDYYFIDPGHGFWIETDLVNATSPSGQVSIGYYAVRTPVCTGCP